MSAERNPFMVELPSRGLLYGENHDGTALLRPMGDREEALLYQQGGDPAMKMAQIIDQCYLSGDTFPPDELLITDRLYILLMLRLEMFGPWYKIPFRCRECRHQEETTINVLEELNKIEMGVDPSTGETRDVREPFQMQYPLSRSGYQIRFRLLRAHDEKAIIREMRNARFGRQRGDTRIAAGTGDTREPDSVIRIARQIVEVGVPNESGDFDWKDYSYAQRVKFVHGLDMADRNEFRLEVESVEGGVDLTLLLDCPACGFTNKFLMPFTEEFLVPSTRLRGRSPRAEVLPRLLRAWGIQWDVDRPAQPQEPPVVSPAASEPVERGSETKKAGSEGGATEATPVPPVMKPEKK
jgi:hypothetical protein